MIKILMVMTYLMMTQTKAENLLNTISEALVQELAAIKSPIVQAVVSVASSQCSNVKELANVLYNVTDQEQEPDLEQLTLVYISSEVTITFNLSSVPTTFLNASWYNPDEELTIFIHGFTDDPYSSTFTTIRNAYAARGKTVLALDCSSLIKWLYIRSTTYVRYIGQRLGQILAALYLLGKDSSKFHLVGHSLGAHIAGMAGKTFNNRTDQKLGRISGLDPAGPCFSYVDEELRLNSTDGVFVDVIHTDGGVYGLKDPLGHVDFYPNGGSQQPNCFFDTCGHSRVWELYSESVIITEAFIGLQCANYDEFKLGQCSGNTSVMGYACPLETRGQFYLQTAKESPYGIGENGTIYVNNDGIVNDFE